MVGLNALVLAQPTMAAAPADLEDLIRQGVELRQKGKDQAALPFFQRAYDLERSPRTAAQLGLAELSLGYSIAAERHLGEALSSPHHLWVARNRTQLETALVEARKAIATVAVAGTPAGAEVLVNGQLVGTIPLAEPVSVPEGTVQILVRAPGFVDNTSQLKIQGGAHNQVQVALVRVAKASGPASPRTVRLRNDAQLTEGASPSAGAPTWVGPAFWVLGAVAATTAAVGVYELWSSRQNMDAFNQKRQPGSNAPACDTGYANYGPAPCRTYFDDANSKQKIGLSAVGVGGLLGMVSLMGLLWYNDNSPTTERHVALMPTAGGIDATWSGRF